VIDYSSISSVFIAVVVDRAWWWCCRTERCSRHFCQVL